MTKTEIGLIIKQKPKSVLERRNAVQIQDIRKTAPIGVRQDMHKISEADLGSDLRELSDSADSLLKNMEGTADKMPEFYQQLLSSKDRELMEEDVKNKLEILENTSRALWKAHEYAYGMGDELSARWRDIKRSEQKHLFFSPPPPNAAIDMAEEATNHFAKKINYYKLFLLCFAGSFLGVVIETFWRFITRGVLENRAGLVYGPFNLLYGAGAVVLTLCLYRFRNRGSFLSFLGGMAVGSVLEYACSFVQELILGSRSWDYSNIPFNINGRICLLFSVFWGVLGVFWIKNIYPRLTGWILKIPDKAGKAAVWILTVFLAFNTVISALAVYRWSNRVEGMADAGGCWKIIDECFPDERMERIFPSMKFHASH